MVARETSIAAGLSELGIEPAQETVEKLERFAHLLEYQAIPAGFLGPHEGPRIVTRHILECAALHPHLGDGTQTIDVGSGAGLPGIVLAILGQSVTLVETTARRADFLRGALADLGIPGDVVQARAEDAGRGDLRESAEAVAARALASPAVALELCLPLARVGGLVVLLAGGPPPSADASRAGRPGAHQFGGLDDVTSRLGGGPASWVPLAVPGAEGARWVIMVEKIRPTPEAFPRRSGAAKKRPLGRGGVTPVN
jgi:16S rRNA (guanine527-N7)-methyltransferase